MSCVPVGPEELTTTATGIETNWVSRETRWDTYLWGRVDWDHVAKPLDLSAANCKDAPRRGWVCRPDGVQPDLRMKSFRPYSSDENQRRWHQLHCHQWLLPLLPLLLLIFEQLPIKSIPEGSHFLIPTMTTCNQNKKWLKTIVNGCTTTISISISALLEGEWRKWLAIW